MAKLWEHDLGTKCLVSGTSKLANIMMRSICCDYAVIRASWCDLGNHGVIWAIMVRSGQSWCDQSNHGVIRPIMFDQGDHGVIRAIMV